MQQTESKRSPYRLGVMVFVGLAVLTLLEYLLAMAGGGSPLVITGLVFVALIKAGLVLWYYMHVRKVFRPNDEGGH